MSKKFEGTEVLETDKKIVAYTHGEIRSGKRLGAWAVTVTQEGKWYETFTGTKRNSRHGYINLKPIHEALKAYGDHPAGIDVYTTSRYGENCVNAYYDLFKENNWVRNGKEMVNAQLIQDIVKMKSDGRKIIWKPVRETDKWQYATMEACKIVIDKTLQQE